jgi:hypothetical protein
LAPLEQVKVEKYRSENVNNPQTAFCNFASAEGVPKSCAINGPNKVFPILSNMLNTPVNIHRRAADVFAVKQAVKVRTMPFFAKLRPTIVSQARNFEDIDTQSC